MNVSNERTIILLLIVSALGCKETIQLEGGTRETIELEGDTREHVSEELPKLHQVKNQYPLKQGSVAVEIAPAKIRRDYKSIELVDLGIKLRLIRFNKPIEGNFEAYFSETEITNQMYAKYLADMNLIRDDSGLAEASTVMPGSTAGTFVAVDSPDDLWREGSMPVGREDHPVSLVTVGQGIAFCEWLNNRYSLDGKFRLPFSEEWVFAAYGTDRQFPWGEEEKTWYSDTTHSVHAYPELQTPDGLLGMWGNVAELVLSRSDGYGGTVDDDEIPFITKWQGASYRDRKADPRQDYWGYTHSSQCRQSDRGFRVCFVSKMDK